MVKAKQKAKESNGIQGGFTSRIQQQLQDIGRQDLKIVEAKEDMQKEPTKLEKLFFIPPQKLCGGFIGDFLPTLRNCSRKKSICICRVKERFEATKIMISCKVQCWHLIKILTATRLALAAAFLASHLISSEGVCMQAQTRQ